MTEVIFFSYNNTTAWWQFLADNLNFTTSTGLLMDVREKVKFCVVDNFYNNLNTKDCSNVAIQHFSAVICDDIIRRCRVLRNMEKPVALAMIGSMWLSLDDVIQREKPKLVVSFIIDRYVLDVLDRILQDYDIPFIGITASIIPEHVMFMARGKLIQFREPEKEEIEQARKLLLNDSFAPSYVSTSKKYNYLLFWRTFLYFKIRGLAYTCIRFLKRDKLNLHYLDAENYLDHKPRLLDFKVLGYLDKNWENRLEETPQEKRVFLGLQLLPEASLDYWLDDLALLNNEELVWQICNVLGGAGFTVFVKDHPLQFGFRKKEIIEKLSALSFVVLVPYGVPATQLIKECPITITCTGTIGFQAVLSGGCAIVSGAYYSDEKHFIHFHSLNDVALLPEKIKTFQQNHTQKISQQSIDDLLVKILSASIPGDLFSFKKFNKKNPIHLKKIQSLLNSLNKYLPDFLILKTLEKL